MVRQPAGSASDVGPLTSTVSAPAAARAAATAEAVLANAAKDAGNGGSGGNGTTGAEATNSSAQANPSASVNTGVTAPGYEGLSQLPFKDAKARLLEAFEPAYLRALLARHQGNITRSANAAGLTRYHLRELCKRYGLRSVDNEPE